MSHFNRTKPFNELPALPPEIELHTKRVLLKTISASRSLAHLNGALVNLPNPTLFIDAVHLQEAKASSEIENIVTTNDELYRMMVSEKADNGYANKEVIRYKEALWLGLNSLRSKPFINTNLCIEIVQCIKRNDAGIRNTPGTTLSTSGGEVIYTPPEGEQVIRDKLAELESFINEDEEVDPLIKMALMHYQFEAIHPFADGNGRTGRILLLLYLSMAGLLEIPAIYLSKYILESKSDYYARLRGVTEEGDWEGYIIYMLDMVESSSIDALTRLNRIVRLMEVTAERIKAELPKIYSKELLEVLFKLPYTKRQFLIDAGLGTAKTVGNYLMELEKIGILKSEKVGKEKLYLNYKLLDQLEMD